MSNRLFPIAVGGVGIAAPLWDRNWVVVDQDPAPGTPIREPDAVLDVLEDDEDHGC